MIKSKISGFLSVVACLALMQSCRQEKEQERPYVANSSSSSKKIQRPIIVDVVEEEPAQAPITTVPVAAVPVDSTVTSLGYQPMPLPLPVIPPLVDLPDVSRDDFSCKECDLATSAFSVTNPNLWYTIDTSSYPTTVPLSINGNKGFDKGDITVTETGVTVNTSGDYWVNITAILSYAPEVPPQLSSTALNPIPAVGSQFIIPVFVARDGVFDPDEENQFGSIGIFPQDEIHIEDVQANGVMSNIKKGTKLSIVAANRGTTDNAPIPLTVIAWSISLYRICD